jgi:hypothetical protein
MEKPNVRRRSTRNTDLRHVGHLANALASPPTAKKTRVGIGEAKRAEKKAQGNNDYDDPMRHEYSST